MFARSKYIESFQSLLEATEKHYIALCWEPGIGKSTFLRTLEEEGLFPKDTTLWISLESQEVSDDITISEEIETIIFDGDVDFSIIRTFIESKSFENRVILTSSKKIEDPEVENFLLLWVSFREYAEAKWSRIEVGDIIAWAADTESMNALRDEYIHLGHFPHHIENPESILEDFEWKCTIMKEGLYEKEYTLFLEYMRTLAMNTGNLFKADQLAKLLSISRRKVHKYTELLMEHGIIRAIGPWWENTDTETTRHVKIYFSDLSFMRSLLWELYFQWQMKQWVIENFLFLELERKLSATHKIHFYRKKSGAEVPFILENHENTMLTVIDVSQRDMNTPSQALKSFDTSYHARVERYMIMNESNAGKKDIWGVMLLILPHIAI